MLPILPIIGLIGTALAVGTVIYLTVKLTISFLKKYKRKKNSKVMAAQVKDLIKNAPTMSLDDLDDDEQVEIISLIKESLEIEIQHFEDFFDFSEIKDERFLEFLSEIKDDLAEGF